MTSPIDNAFEAPQAELSDIQTDKPILEIERFSAWFVFLLSMVTLGFYTLYWLYSRSVKINALAQEKKTNMNALYAYIFFFTVYTLVSYSIDENSPAMMMGIIALVSGIAYLVTYVMTVFSMRLSVAEVINKGGDGHVQLGGIMTFFFSAIYFQYKINEAIDSQR